MEPIDLDMGELILPKIFGEDDDEEDPPNASIDTTPWHVFKSASAKGVKRPAEDASEGAAGSSSHSKRPLTAAEADERRIDREDVETVRRALEAIREHVTQRERENNEAFDKNQYPEWRLVPLTEEARARHEEATAAAAAARLPLPAPPRVLAQGRKLALHKLLSCDDDTELKEHGAALVSYADFIRASNEKVDVSLLGCCDDHERYNQKISRGNRESATFHWAMESLPQLIASVPSFNGEHKLTGMQRLSTALTTSSYGTDVHIAIKEKGMHSTKACYALHADTQTDVIINNLSVAAGKTRATIYATMCHISTKDAWEATQKEYTKWMMQGVRVPDSGLHQLPTVTPDKTKLARVVVALVPAPVMQQWVQASQKLSGAQKEGGWVTWCGLSSIQHGSGKSKTYTEKNMPEAIKVTKAKKCALFWVLEANTKSSTAALFSAPEYGVAYRIIDEGTGSHLTEPRTRKAQSVCRYTIICNATLEQLEEHTRQQPKHPLRRAMGGANMNLTSSHHCAIATLCSLPSWLRLAVGLSMEPFMPRGILKICMRVQVKSLAGTLNKGSDMVLTSMDDLVDKLILEHITGAITGEEKRELRDKCSAILNRTDPTVSIADNLTRAIEQVHADENALLPLPKPEEGSNGYLSVEQQVVAEGIRRYQKVYGTMKRLFTNLLAAICPDPPPECPITLDAIEPQNVCILSCCTTLIDKRSVEQLTNQRCPMCRQPITGLASAAQAAEVIAPEPPKPPPETVAEKPLPEVLSGNSDSLVRAFKAVAGAKCNSSLEAVVKSLELALRFKPMGLRVLLCCNICGPVQTYNASLDEEKNTAKTCAFLREALPQMTSVSTMGKGTKSMLDNYKAADKSNRVCIIDTSARSTTMAGLDLPNTDVILFDRLGGTDAINLSKVVQSIGRAMRAQKKDVDAHKEDERYFAKWGYSRHAPKIVVFLDKYRP